MREHASRPPIDVRAVESVMLHAVKTALDPRVLKENEKSAILRFVSTAIEKMQDKVPRTDTLSVVNSDTFHKLMRTVLDSLKLTSTVSSKKQERTHLQNVQQVRKRTYY